MKPITLLLFITLLGCSSASGQDTTTFFKPWTTTTGRTFINTMKPRIPAYPLVIVDSVGNKLARRDSLGKWEIWDCDKAFEVIYQYFKKSSR